MPAPSPSPRTKSSCVVFGMPKEAIARDAVDRIVNLSAHTPCDLKRPIYKNIGSKAEPMTRMVRADTAHLKA